MSVSLTIKTKLSLIRYNECVIRQSYIIKRPNTAADAVAVAVGVTVAADENLPQFVAVMIYLCMCISECVCEKVHCSLITQNSEPTKKNSNNTTFLLQT